MTEQHPFKRRDFQFWYRSSVRTLVFAVFL
jgi:hypothetical protein